MGYHGPSADLLYPGVCERHEPPGPNSYARLRIPFSRFLPQSSVQGGFDVIRKEAWPFYRTSSGVRLCWELEEPKGPKGRGRLLVPNSY